MGARTKKATIAREETPTNAFILRLMPQRVETRGVKFYL
jgi:hypothetical protein